MTTPKPDLDLRLAVCRAINPDSDSWIDGDQVYMEDPCDNYARDRFAEVDLSFDAILPLVKALNQQELATVCRFLREIHFSHVKHNDYFEMWLLREPTPTDYCAAFLAAKEGK